MCAIANMCSICNGTAHAVHTSLAFLNLVQKQVGSLLGSIISYNCLTAFDVSAGVSQPYAWKREVKIVL